MKLLLDTIRSIVANQMLSWAVSVAPEDEKTSMRVALVQHFDRAIKLMERRREEARR